VRGVKATLHALKSRIAQLRFAFLVLPVLATILLALLAVLTLWIDSRAGPNGVRLGLGDDADTARTILNGVIGAVAAVAAITFSIAIVALQLVSQQFSPRALRTFLGDRLNQLIAGTFAGTILYSLLVLRAVDGSGDERFLPSLATTVAAALAVVSFFALLVFVSHISQRVQVSRIASDIADSGLGRLGDLYPEPFGEPDTATEAEELLRRWYADGDPQLVHPTSPGYVQSAALDDLPKLLGHPGFRMQVLVAPGDFVAHDEPLAAVWGAAKPADEVERVLRRAVAVSDERDDEQDFLYPVRQLADIAIKAISPSINDPTTAWTCISYMGVLVERLVLRGLPARVRRYPGDRVVVVRRQELAEFVEVGFIQVGRYASRDARVAGRLLEELGRVARAVSSPDELELVERAAATVAEPALDDARTQHDRDELERRLALVHDATRR